MFAKLSESLFSLCVEQAKEPEGEHPLKPGSFPSAVPIVTHWSVFLWLWSFPTLLYKLCEGSSNRKLTDLLDGWMDGWMGGWVVGWRAKDLPKETVPSDME
jgi:hypothetical protein